MTRLWLYGSRKHFQSHLLSVGERFELFLLARFSLGEVLFFANSSQLINDLIMNAATNGIFNSCCDFYHSSQKSRQ